MTAADTPDLNWTLGPFSAAAWYNGPANQNGVYLDIFGRNSYSNESVNSGWSLSLRALDDTFAGPNFIIFNNNGSSAYHFASTATYAAGDQMIAGTSDGSSTKSIYVNLRKDISTSINFAPATQSTNGPQSSPTEKLYIAAVWNRQLSDGEIQSFYYAPFGLVNFVEDVISAQIMAKGSGAGSSFLAAWARGRNVSADGVAT